MIPFAPNANLLAPSGTASIVGRGTYGLDGVEFSWVGGWWTNTAGVARWLTEIVI